MPDDAEIHVQQGTLNFLLQGGVYRIGLNQMRKDGRLPRHPVHLEYPKMLRISEGIQEFERETETCRNTTIRWTEKKEVFREIIVESEEEEERVLSGGKSSAQLEQDRQLLIQRCHNLSIPVDPNWSAVRLRRELGDKLDEPAEKDPVSKMAALENELAMLRKMADMQAEIERLRSSLQPAPIEDEGVAELRAQLTALGVAVDGRWSLRRLQAELDRATSPGRAA
jgi:hypothetical protein